MKFFFGILLLALVALASAEEAKNLKPENAAPVNEAEPANARNKRGFVYSAYSAPVVAAPIATTYAAAAPVAYAGVPYAYSAYSAYSPYYSGVPAVYY